MNEIILILLFGTFLIFLIYFFVSLFRSENVNYFLDEWMERTLWIWLPFYALWRLIREVIFHKR